MRKGVRLKEYILKGKPFFGEFEKYVISIESEPDKTLYIGVLSHPETRHDRRLIRKWRRCLNKEFVVPPEAGSTEGICEQIATEIEGLTDTKRNGCLADEDCDKVFGGGDYGFFACGTVNEEQEDPVGALKVLTDEKYRPRKIKWLLVSFTGPVSVYRAAKAAEEIAGRYNAKNVIISVSDDDDEQNSIKITVIG